jgi:hypothetical protein
LDPLSPGPSPRLREKGGRGEWFDGGRGRGLNSPPLEGCPKGGVVGGFAHEEWRFVFLINHPPTAPRQFPKTRHCSGCATRQSIRTPTQPQKQPNPQKTINHSRRRDTEKSENGSCLSLCLKCLCGQWFSKPSKTRRSNPTRRMDCHGPSFLAMTTGEASGHKISLKRRGIYSAIALAKSPCSDSWSSDWRRILRIDSRVSGAVVVFPVSPSRLSKGEKRCSSSF